MTRLPLLICLVLVAAALRAFAEGPDDQYLRIYELIQQGDSLAFSGQSSQSMAKYVEAQTALQKFQKGYPDWNDQIVKFRLNYLEGKISALASQLPAAAGPQAVATGKPSAPSTPSAQPAVSPELQNQINALSDQVRQLQAERTVLQAKLKEAFAAQPAGRARFCLSVEQRRFEFVDGRI